MSSNGNQPCITTLQTGKWNPLGDRDSVQGTETSRYLRNHWEVI